MRYDNLIMAKINKIASGFFAAIAIFFAGSNFALAEGVNTNLDLVTVLKNIEGIMWYVLAALAFFAILSAAFMFITQAGGNAEKAAQARRWLVYIVIGLLIGIAANGIIAFVVSTLGIST